MEMDANAKLGPNIVKGDPKEQTNNGKLLLDVVKENDLTIVNGTNLCEDVITRSRKTVNNTEESVLDYFIVCSNFLKLIKKMKVDEEQIYSLSSYSKRNGDLKVKKSDHNILYLEIDRKWKTFLKNTREEIFNYNDDEGFKKFISLTNQNQDLLNCFNDENEDIDISAKKWLKTVNHLIRQSFRKK